MTEKVKFKTKRTILKLPKKTVEKLVQSVIDEVENAQNEVEETPNIATPVVETERQIETQPELPVLTQESDLTPVLETPTENIRKTDTLVNSQEIFYRAATIDAIDRSSDPDKRVLSLSFSSETPIPRSYGMEVLSHATDAVNLTRLNAAGPVLLDHNTTKQVGVVQRAWIDQNGKKGRATVQFSKSQLGTEVWTDIQDGVRKNVSVGYSVSGKPQVNGETYTWKNWEPSHIAIVSEPADITVGINRSKQQQQNQNEVELNTNTNSTLTEGVITKMEATQVVNKEDVLTAERNRVNEIRDAARKYQTDAEVQKLADHAEKSGMEPAQFYKEVYGIVSSKKNEVKLSPANIGLTASEARNFSISRMVNHLLDPTNKKLTDEAGFEIEVSKATREKFPSTRGGNSFSIPNEVSNARKIPLSRSNVDVTVAANLIETEVLMASYIDVLRNACQVSNLGATHVDGLVNTVQIPRRSAASTAYWLATDSSALTESPGTFDDITLSPHTLTGATYITRQALAQIPGIDAIVTQDLARTSGIALDAACLSGAGSSGVPKGLLNLSSIPTVALGTNGGAPTYAAVVKMIGALAAANALFGKLAFLGEAFGFETMSTTLKDSSNTASNYILGGTTGDVTHLSGYPYVMSNNVPSNLTKGTETNCSALIFGNWQDAVIGSWGTQEILVDPYSQAANNMVALYCFGMYDFNVRHLGSFAVIVDLITGNSA